MQPPHAGAGLIPAVSGNSRDLPKPTGPEVVAGTKPSGSDSQQDDFEGEFAKSTEDQAGQEPVLPIADLVSKPGPLKEPGAFSIIGFSSGETQDGLKNNVLIARGKMPPHEGTILAANGPHHATPMIAEEKFTAAQLLPTASNGPNETASPGAPLASNAKTNQTGLTLLQAGASTQPKNPVTAQSIPQAATAENTNSIALKTDSAPKITENGPSSFQGTKTVEEAMQMAKTSGRSMTESHEDQGNRPDKRSQDRVNVQSAPAGPDSQTNLATSGSPQSGSSFVLPTAAEGQTLVNQLSLPEGMADTPLEASVRDVERTDRIGLDAPVLNTTDSVKSSTRPTEQVRAITMQLAEAVQRGQDGAIELTLRPEELGRLRMSLQPGDGSMHIVLQAERGETMDLLRRNIGALQQEFLDMGYESISFEFGSSAQSDSEPDASSQDTESDAPPAGTLADNLPQSLHSYSGGLDLRV